MILMKECMISFTWEKSWLNSSILLNQTRRICFSCSQSWSDAGRKIQLSCASFFFSEEGLLSAQFTMLAWLKCCTDHFWRLAHLHKGTLDPIHSQYTVPLGDCCDSCYVINWIQLNWIHYHHFETLHGELCTSLLPCGSLRQRWTPIKL